MRRSIVLLLPLACGPQVPVPGDETATATAAESTGATTTAPGPDTTPPDPTTGPDDTSSGPPPEPTGGTSDGTGDDTGDGTTGEHPTCPEDQPALASRWAVAHTETDSRKIELADGPIAALSDGRVVTAISLSSTTGKFSPALLFMSLAHGSPGETKALAWGPQVGKVNDLAVDAGDEIVVIGTRVGFEDDTAYLLRVDPAGNTLAELALPQTFTHRAALQIDDGYVIAGDGPGGQRALAEIDRSDGSPMWVLELAGPDDLRVRDLARGSDGALVVLADSDEVEGRRRTLNLTRATGDGELVWSANFEPPRPFDSATAVEITPDGTLVALTSTWSGEPAVEAVGLRLADGALSWALQLAGPDASGSPWARTILADEGGFTVPVSRSLAAEPQAFSDPVSITVHRVTTGLEVLDLGPLPSQPHGSVSATGHAARGPCRELMMMTPRDASVWLAVHEHE
jgi:hypothetical protein